MGKAERKGQMMEESPLMTGQQDAQTETPAVLENGRDLTEGRATFNLLVEDRSPEQVREAVKWARVLGVTPEEAAAMDNRDLHVPYTAEGLPRKTQEFLAERSPFLARGYANATSEMRELEASMSGKRDTVLTKWDLLLSGEGGEKEAQKLRGQKEAELRRAREAVARQVEREKKKLALVLELSRRFDNWNEETDADLKGSIELIHRETGIDFSDIPLDELRKKGAGDLDAGNLVLDAVNLFGWHDIAKAVMRKTPEELASVSAESSIEEQLDLLSVLKEQTDAVRGWTFTAKAISGVVQSLPYLAEFWITGGVPVSAATAAGRGAVKLTTREAIALALREGGFAAGKKGFGFWRSAGTGLKAMTTAKGWKALGKAGGIALGMEAAKTPLYVPQATARAYDEWAGKPLYLVGEGGIKTVVPDRYTDELATLVTRELVRGFLERYSEYGSEFLPAVDFSKALPEGMRKGLVQTFLNYVSKDSAKRNLFAMRFARNAPIGNFVSEWLEEKGADFFQWVSTGAAELTGEEALNMGRGSVWGSAEDEFLTLTVVTAYSALNGMAVRGIPSLKAYAQVSREVDNFRENVDKLTKLEAKLNSEPLTEEYVNYLRPDGRTLFVKPEDGAVFYQTAPEMAKALGITEESISDAKENRTLIAVDENALLLESAKGPEAKKNGEILFQSTIASTGQAVGSIMDGEAGTEIREQYQERKKLVTEFQDRLLAELAAAGALPGGVTERGKKAAIRLAAMATAKLYRATTTEEGKKLVEDALNALRFVIAEESKVPADPTAMAVEAIDNAVERVERPGTEEKGEGPLHLEFRTDGTAPKPGSDDSIYAFQDLQEGVYELGGKIFHKKGDAFELDGKTLSAREIEKIFRSPEAKERDASSGNTGEDAGKGDASIGRNRPNTPDRQEAREAEASGETAERSGEFTALNKAVLEAMAEEDEAKRLDKLVAIFGPSLKLTPENDNESIIGKMASKRYLAFKGTGITKSELVSDGSTGLLNAALRFNTEKATAPFSYFSKAIGNAMNDHLKKLGADAKILSSMDSTQEDAEGRKTTLGDKVASTLAAEDRAAKQAETDAILNEAMEKAALTEEERKVLLEAYKHPWGRNGVSYVGLARALGMEVKAARKIHQEALKKVQMAALKLKGEIYQQANPANGEAVKGQISFADEVPFSTSLDATITLFGTADASTLPHELAHWTKALMGALVSRGFASDQLKADWEALNKWLDGQKYTSAEGTQERHVEREEKFARAFEAYIQTGRAPGAETQSAFYTLRQMIAAVYQYAKRYLMDRYGFELSDDIKAVFDHLLDTDRVMREQSPLLDALEELKGTFGKLLGLSKEEAKSFQRLAEQAHAESVNALEKRKRMLLPGLRARWRAEAQDLMGDMDVYKLWNEIVTGGGLDAALLEEGLSGLDGKARRALLRTLRRLKLTAKASEAGGLDAAALAATYKYASIRDMAEELADTVPPKDFVKNYLNQMETAFNETLEIDGTELTEKKMLDLLDALTSRLASEAEKGGGTEGWRRRKRELTAQVEKELSEMKVSQVLSDTGLLRKIRNDSGELVKAIGKKDFVTALDRALDVRKNLVLLGEKGKAAKRVERTKRILKRANGAEKGVIFEAYGDALKELYYVFGINDKKEGTAPSLSAVPNGYGNWREVVRDRNANDDLEKIYRGAEDTEKPEAGPSLWARFLFRNDRTSYRELTYEDFEVLSDFTDFLNGTGRELTNKAKESDAVRRAGLLEKCLESLGAWTAKYHNRKAEKSKLGTAARRFLLVGRNLRTYMAMADKFSHIKGNQGGNLDLWDILAADATRQVELYTGTLDQVRPHTETLARLVKEKKILLPTGVQFTGNGLQNGYSEWTANMVIAFCLNMGNVTNRSRVQQGYEWTDEQMERVMACMPEEGWRAIQGIWDALSGPLQSAVAETFLRERHYRLKLVQAQAFAAKTADGSEVVELRGGYYPIYYAARTQGGEARIDEKGVPLFANASSTQERAGELAHVDPVSLEPGCLDRHIKEASHYAATRMGCRDVMSVLMNGRYKEAYGSALSYEAYNEMLTLAKELANPADEIKTFADAVARWARTGLTAGALMINFRSMGMQYTSLTVGADELGEYYVAALQEGLLHPMETARAAKELSAFMRHRAAYYNIDAAESLKAFDKGALDRFQQKTAVVGYYLMKTFDLHVASIMWTAKYNQVRDQLLEKGGLTLAEIREKAVAAADGFVARTQGSNRQLELTTTQLSEIGRALTPFLTAANAQYNTLLERFVLPLTSGTVSFTELAGPLMANLILPSLLAAVVSFLLPRGSDDDKKLPFWTRRFLAGAREALSSPLSGVPVVRDLWDAALGAAFTKIRGRNVHFTGAILSARELEEISKVFRMYAQSTEAVFDGNAARAFYKAAEATGWMLHVPVLQAYERAKRDIAAWDIEPDWMKAIDDEVNNRNKGGKK